MTERQKEALREIRKDVNWIRGHYLNNIKYAVLIINALDAIEADGKCKRIPIGGPDEVCSECGWEFDDSGKKAFQEVCCPGCGREIEAAE